MINSSSSEAIVPAHSLHEQSNEDVWRNKQHRQQPVRIYLNLLTYTSMQWLQFSPCLTEETRRKLESLHLETKMKFSRWMHTLTLGVKQLKIKSKILGWFWRQTLYFSSHVKALNQHTIISKKLQELDVLFPVKTWRNLFMPLSPAGWIIVMVSSPTFPRRPLDSCSSSRTLLPGFWLEPENLSISHQSSGPYTGFQLHLGLILKYFYSFINHSVV